MSKAITKITAENFSDAVKYAHAYKRKRAVARLTRKVILPLGSLLFFLNALLITLGAFSALLTEVKLVTFETPDFITGYWEGVLAVFRSITPLWGLHIPMMLVYLFLLPYAVCSVLALAVALLTRVKGLTVSGTVPEQAKQLSEYASDIPTAYRDDEEAHQLWRRITGIAFPVGIAAYAVYLIVAVMNAGDESTDNSMLFLLTEGFLGVLIAVALLCFVYFLLHRLFTLIIRPYYIADDQTNKLSSAAHSYWVSVDPEEQRKAKAARERAKSRKPKAPASTTHYSGGYVGGSSAGTGESLSFSEKEAYILHNCHSAYSPSAMDKIDNDPNLTASQKAELKHHLFCYGD